MDGFRQTHANFPPGLMYFLWETETIKLGLLLKTEFNLFQET